MEIKYPPPKTPKLARVERVILNARGDNGTSWSREWKMDFWKRLNNGNRSHKNAKKSIKTCFGYKY